LSIANFVRDELPVRQPQEEVVCQVLPEEEGALLATGGAEEEGLAREGPEIVEPAVGAADTGDAVLPITTGVEGGRCLDDQGKPVAAVLIGVLPLVGGLEGMEAFVEEALEIGLPARPVGGSGTRRGRGGQG